MSEMTSESSMENDRQDAIESIAARIFSRHGIDFATVERAGGWTNAVWIGAELVLRLSQKKGNKCLLDETILAGHFPPEVGYPQVVDSGMTRGHAWMLTKRLPGISLGAAWADLDLERRVTALQGLWARAEAVHSIPWQEIEASVPRRAWFNNTEPLEALASLGHLTQKRILTYTQVRRLRENLNYFWAALQVAPFVLCHGDLTMDNAIWHEGRVIALLDFEFAVMAPIQLDLNHLVKCAFGPANHETSPTRKDTRRTQSLQQAVKEIALPLLEQPADKALLVGYAILLELWLLETWLAHPEGEGPLELWEPLRRLQSLADGKGGYLAPLLH